MKVESLPKLNGVEVALGPGGQRFAARSVVLRRPNGTLLRVSGRTSLRIRLSRRSGPVDLYFYAPVLVRIVGGTLVIQSANHPEMSFLLKKVRAFVPM